MFYRKKDFAPSIHEVETLELELPNFSKRDPKYPGFEVAEWCQRCDAPSRDVITHAAPCQICGFPGLKEEKR